MADFSKQYIERQFEDPQFPWDFDISEIGNGLENDHIHPIICEGYGFIGVYKSTDGKVQLAFDNPMAEFDLEMVDLEDLDRRYEEHSLPWQKRGR
jgi:hypothetical protein